MTFTTAERCQRRWSAAAPLPVNTFSRATHWQRDHKKREGPLEKTCTSRLCCWLVKLCNTLLTNTFSTGQDTVNNGGTHGYLTGIEDETDVHTCRKRALLFHMRLCKVGFTFLRSQDFVHLATSSLINSVNALWNGVKGVACTFLNSQTFVPHFHISLQEKLREGKPKAVKNFCCPNCSMFFIPCKVIARYVQNALVGGLSGCWSTEKKIYFSV